MIEFLKSINEKTYPILKELSQKDDLDNDKLMALIMYESKEHNIAFRDETVTVPTSEVIALLTGINSLSTIKNDSCDEFNSTVKKLVAKDYSTDDLQYAKIAEGILTQEPGLVELADAYSKFCKNLDKTKTTVEQIESFMKSLDKYGFSEELTLKTIIPDKNALINPTLTLFIFKNRQKINSLY